MNAMKPVVGQWYRGGTNELFEVVAIDDQDETIEIPIFRRHRHRNGFDAWNEQLLDRMLDVGGCTEDWSGAVDVESEDWIATSKTPPSTAWSTPEDRSLRR